MAKMKVFGDLEVLDVMAVISFVVGLQNLDMNITQEDIQELAKHADETQTKGIEDIHRHLAIQDDKLNKILDKLGVMEDEASV